MQKQILCALAIVLGLFLLVPLVSDTAAFAAPATQGNCDNGPTVHAQGELRGDRYVVIWGDTVFSISRRFCISENALRRANGIGHWDRLLAGSTIVIPKTDSGNGSCDGDTTIAILAPPANSRVGAEFAVRGEATVRRNSVVIIRAFDEGDRLLAQRDTRLNWQGPSNNCTGFFDVTLSVSVPNGTRGYLIATTNDVSSARVPVIYETGQSGTCPSPFLTIATPVAGNRLPITFTVSGQGCLALGSPRVEVRAVNAAGSTLATQIVALENDQYSASLTVNPGFEQGGRIIVTGLGTTVQQQIAVIFTTSGGGTTNGAYTDFNNLNCRIVLAGNEAGYYYPNGPLFGALGGGERRVIARLELAGVVWYMVEIPFQGRGYTLWARAGDLAGDPAGCG